VERIAPANIMVGCATAYATLQNFWFPRPSVVTHTVIGNI